MVKVVMDSDNKWRIQREIPIALIVGLAMQTFLFVGYVASHDAKTDMRLESLEHARDSTATQLGAMNAQAVATGRLEEKVNTLQSDMSDVKHLLQNQEAPLYKPRSR